MEPLFAADLHFGQETVVKYRNHFKSSLEHDSIIYENISRQLNKKTTLYLLGDLCFSKDSLKYLKGFKELCHSVVVIGGNHCTEKISVVDLYESVSQVHFYKNKYGFTLSHMPIHPEHLRGKLNVHGHLHTDLVKDPRYVCVSLEHTNYKAMSLTQIREVFRSRILDLNLSDEYLNVLKSTG
jgi:calcineurin-like phosphoesterase family protein